MAKHATHKNSTDGKTMTAARRVARVRKYAAPGLDLDRLATELHREQAARAAKVSAHTNEAAARRAANLTDN